MSKPMKVILFDSWTKGHIHIIRLLDALKEQNIEIHIVHIGSWGDEVGRPEKEIIAGINVHDISAYRNLEAVLHVEKPDLVLFLSLDPLLHRAFNRYCIANKVPTVNLYHGVHSVLESLSAEKKNIHDYWMWAISRMKRTIKYIFPTYIISLIKTKADLKDWLTFFSEIGNKIIGVGVSKASNDAVTNYICVFNDYDIKHARKKYSAPLNKIVAVGYPDILKFNGLEESIFKFIEQDSTSEQYAVYIGTGVRGTKMMLTDSKEYYQHLVQTNNLIKKMNKKLVCKLHYSRLNEIKDYAQQDGSDIIFCGDDEFIDTLKKSCGSIIEPSTAGLVPILMGKPVFLAQYGKLSGLLYGPALSSYPKSSSLSSWNDFSLIGEATFNNLLQNETEEWIKSISGPLPASDMPNRVVEVINRAINAR